MKETKERTIPRIRDTVLFCTGLLTVLLVPGLILAQTYAEKIFYKGPARPESPYYQSFYLRNRLDRDVTTAKKEREFDALLRDLHEGKIDKVYLEAIREKPMDQHPTKP